MEHERPARWLVRWLRESQQPSIETPSELAATLADVADDAKAMPALLGLLG